MTKVYSVFLAVVLAFTVLAGCGTEAETSADGAAVEEKETVETSADGVAVEEQETVETSADESVVKEQESRQMNITTDSNHDFKEHLIPSADTPEANPLKGLVPFADATSFPITMEWFYMAVNEVEIAEGVYDWTALESSLEPIAARGHQAVLRFYYDYPGEKSGVPQYLIDKYGLEMRPYNEQGDLGGAGLCPDYSNADFRKSMQNFIAAFGKEYDGDPRIGYITEGLLGFWGEWHNWPFDEDTSDGKPNWNIPAQVYTEVYESFDNAFDITGLLVREPKPGIDNESFGTGFHDDSFAYETLSADAGGQDFGFMQKLKDQKVADAWQSRCIGGEVYPPIQKKVFGGAMAGAFGEPVQDWDKCVNETHVSWLICDQIKEYRGATREKAIEASKKLGYDLQVTRAFYMDTVGKDTSLPIRVEIKNNGVAPFYYDHRTWPVMIGVKKGDDLIKTWETDWDLPKVKADGIPVMFQTTIDSRGLDEGTCTLCIKVKNPLEGGCLFHFSNKGELSDGWLSLGTVVVK
jgi:hypothetical protein